MLADKAALVISAAEANSLFADLQSSSGLLLAVSGGPDSTALLVLAARWLKALKRKPQLVAVTVDHGLRPEAKREAADVARLAKKLGVPHRTVRWAGKKPKTGLQQAARRARYELLAAAARRAGADYIMTAHTLDDQAETVLFRMARGSGITGLSAMRRVSTLSFPSPERGGSIARSAIGVRSSCRRSTPTRRASLADLPLSGGGNRPLFLVRPFLDIPKARLVATLHSLGIKFADDPSNRDPRFTRARLRGVMPVLAREGLDAHRLSVLARRVRRVDAAVEAVVDRAMVEFVANGGGQDVISIDTAKMHDAPAEIALRVVGRAIAAVGNEGPVELAKLESLMAALALSGKTAAETRFRRTLAGAMVTFDGNGLLIERAPPRHGRGRGKNLTKRASGSGKKAKAR
ncbi:MAG TPA: tRNA lysidine(34) synthetase TilS [Pseudolabrys sp.]|nr:tRNA lysidine(34) synthetase TilS [Pseudolabrys sp.]